MFACMCEVNDFASTRTSYNLFLSKTWCWSLHAILFLEPNGPMSALASEYNMSVGECVPWSACDGVRACPMTMFECGENT